MWPYFLLFFSTGVLILLFYRRYRMNRLANLAKNIVAEDASPILHEEVSAEKAEILTRDISLDEHFEMKELFRRAEAYFLSGDFDESEKLYVQILSIHSFHEESHARLGLIYLKKNLPTKAEAIYRKLLGLQPGNPSYHSNLALALYMQRKFPEARDEYFQAIELDPVRPQRYINLSHVYRDMGQFDDAIAALEKALQQSPEEGQYRLILAELFCDIKRFSDAKTIVQNVLKHEDRKSSLRPMARTLMKKIEKSENILATSPNL